MKIKAFLFSFFLFLNFGFKAQTYVTIPDATFVWWLQTNYPNCMNGNQMNIDCAEIQNEDTLYVNTANISDLFGSQYFINLKILSCSANHLTYIPTLSNTLEKLSCSNNNLLELPQLPNTLSVLDCSWNNLTNLPQLPDAITELDCRVNSISNIPNLPINLINLNCSYNQLINLPDLPPNVQTYYCSYNLLTSLSNLSSTLIYLDCHNNQLISLPTLPDNLIQIECSNNQLTNFPNLPLNLNALSCSYNTLVSLPNLPSNLQYFSCESNQLSTMPSLPNQLLEFSCNNNLLTNLPNLPNTLTHFKCSYNQLYTLPILPESLYNLECNNNNISCFNNFPTSISNLNLNNNIFTCLPNYISSMNSETLLYPLCIENDIINNPYNCNSSNGIVGSIFLDTNLNCIFENSEKKLGGLTLKLYNNSDSLIRQIYSLSNGIYQFNEAIGIYKVKIDTLDLPFSVQCQSTDTTLTLDSQNTFVDSVNFALNCKPGFDVGAQSVATNGWVFPGQNHDLRILAGDMSQWYNMTCASGISGEVQITVSGPITFQNPILGSLIPTVSGNTFTYTISDFGNVDFNSAFGLNFKTDTTAQGGDEICASINVTPTNGDNNMSNNIYEYCYEVVNSYDPNMKEVYPVNVNPGYDDYFTYTIHFQNTGSAPAFNIRLLDTLDANLDLETFQVTNYSHYNSTMLKNNMLTFHFPNIMLVDSTTDLEGSKGFVQYRIKPKTNLALGTQIKNTANIYFDFNAPIVTNTTVNEYVQTNSLAENESKMMNIFPNPFSSSTMVIFKNSLKNANLTLYTIFGQKVRTISDFSGDKLKINRENLASGVYYLNLESENNQVETVKLVVGE
ncbi:MAG: T9SS type A sorting domain-containing protein [Bacteroidota bacterium]